MKTIVYLKQELQFTAREYSELNDQDKLDLKEYARVEMQARGLSVD